MDASATALVAIQQVLNRYPQAVDERDWATFDRVFTADVTCDMTSVGLGVTRDRDELVARFDAIEHPVAHHLVNPVIDLVDADHATVTSKWLVVLADRTTLGGNYHDDLVRADGQWRIRARRVTDRQEHSRRPVAGYDLEDATTTGDG